MTRPARRKLAISVGVLALLGVALAGALRSEAVQDAGMARVVRARLGHSIGDVTGLDALHVLVCGSGSPMPSPERAQACVVVFAGGHGYVFDIGTGASGNIANWRAPAERISRVFLTHFHSDHFGDLGELNLLGWVAGRPGPLYVHGPPGVARVVNGLNEAYALDLGYRVAHHGAELLPPERGALAAVPFAIGDESEVVYEAGELTIRAFALNHAPVAPAVGYRVDYRGRSVVISGDTAPSEALVEAARGADLLLHEALAPHIVATLERESRAAGEDRIATVMADIPDYHTTPIQAARAANAAEVGRLVLYHLVPGPPGRLAEEVFLRGVRDVRADTTLAVDGSMFTLPVGTDDVSERRVP